MIKTIDLSVRNLNERELSECSKDDICIPQIAITLRSNITNESFCQYLYPLRGYFFQIGGINAHGAIVQGHHFFNGAEGLIKSCKIVGMTDSGIKDIFNSEASACVMDYIKKFTEIKRMDSKSQGDKVNEYYFSIDPMIGSRGVIYEDSAWRKFINDTFEYYNRNE